MTVFVDTSGIYAALDAADNNHEQAQDAFADILRHRTLLTHSYVLVESTALVLRRLGAEAVRVLVDDLLPPVRIVWVDEGLHRRAVAAMLASGRSDISLVDWTSFQVMRDHGLAHALAFDRHFADRGFELIPA